MIKTESAGGIVIGPHGKILVVDQGDSWSLPKGHIENGENILAAAKREICEETGIKNLELVRTLGSYKRTAIDKPDEIKTIYMYLFTTGDLKLKPLVKDSVGARWVTKEKVASLLTHPKDKEFFLSLKDKI